MNPALDHLLDDVHRLGFVLVERLDLEDLFLLLDSVRRNFGDRDIVGIRRSNLQSDVVSNLVGSADGLDHDADLAAHVNVAADSRAVRRNISFKPSDDNLFADLGDGLVEQIRLCRRNVLDARRSRVDDVLGNLADKRLELVALRDEVGLAIDLDERVNAVFAICVDDTLRGYLACSLGAGRHSLFAENVNRFVHIAVGFNQSLFAIHHAYARLGAQIHNILVCEVHNYSFLSSASSTGASSAAGALSSAGAACSSVFSPSSSSIE